MECKVLSIAVSAVLISYWNISRMECKVKYDVYGIYLINIGIYPEWNVKVLHVSG